HNSRADITTDYDYFSCHIRLPILDAPLTHIHAFPCKQANRFQLGCVNKADDDFLYSCLFIFRQALSNHRGGANQRFLTELVKIVAILWREFCVGCLLCIIDRAIIYEDRTPDAVVVGSKIVTMTFENGEVMLVVGE